MRLSSIVTISATFVLAAALSLVAARFSVTVIEETTHTAVNHRLEDRGIQWATVDTNGLQIFLAGTAPSEAQRFKALSTAGTVVDAARIIDQMLVAEQAEIEPPRFSIEILRNDSGVSLIGLTPEDTDRAELVAEIAAVTQDEEITDFLETADYPVPETWGAALDYAVAMLERLPRAKISVDAERVGITAMADSAADKRSLETDLAREAPSGVRLALDISAPRPVITPFTLRFLIEDGKARFDACSADSAAALEKILTAAGKAGLRRKAECVIGLGVPSPKWGDAAAQAITALAELGAGSVTFSDADISLVAARGTPQDTFDDVVGRLENALPEVFALHAVLPEPPDESEPDKSEFVATLSPEGLVQIRGRLASEDSRDTVASLAKARFSSDAVHTTARVAEGLPGGWSRRVLTGIEALALLSNGAVTVTPDEFKVVGNTGRKEASADISALLSNKLGKAAQFSIDVTYQEDLDPVASKPTPQECEARIAEVQADRKINFEPGSSNVNPSGAKILDEIAEILKECGEIRMEIGGHTDSQGREVMNQRLSQARARAVLNELRMRRVLTSSFTAKGYGESQPIADNESEEGREANRRIEFKLVRPEKIAQNGDGEADGPSEDTAEQEAAAETEEGATNEQN